jgi:hypothetical protein
MGDFVKNRISIVCLHVRGKDGQIIDKYTINYDKNQGNKVNGAYNLQEVEEMN